VLSHDYYNNGIEVYKEGRWKRYFFSVKDSEAVELFCPLSWFLARWNCTVNG
jgi:hypothetical protein